MTKTKGNTVTDSDYFYANHSHDVDTNRYVSGIILFLNKTSVQSY